MGVISTLPNEYMKLEYIENPSWARIVTDYEPKQGDEVEMRFLLPTISSSQQTLFSAGTGTYQFVAVYGGSSNNGFWTRYFASTSPYAASVLSANTWYDYTLNNLGTFACNNVSATSSYEAAIDGNDTKLQLFRRITNQDYPFKGKIAYFRITNNNMPQLNLIPCIRNSDGKIGMYDMVGQKFYSSATESYQFIAGPIITCGSLNSLEMRRRTLITQIKEVSALWNQLALPVNSSNWKDYSSDTKTTYENEVGTMTWKKASGGFYASNTTTSFPTLYTKGDVLYFSYEIMPCKDQSYDMELGGDIVSDGGRFCAANEWTRLGFLRKSTKADGTMAPLIVMSLRSGNSAIGDTCKWRNPIYINITKMFGAGHEPRNLATFEIECKINGINLNNYYPADRQGTQRSWLKLLI